MVTMTGAQPAANTPPGDHGTGAGGRRATFLATLRSWLVLPVFFDLVWQDSASPMVSYIIVLKVVKCVFVVLTQGTDFLKKELKKKKVKAKGAAVVGAAVKDKFRSLKKFARYAFNTVTTDSFTCKAHKSSALKGDFSPATAQKIQRTSFLMLCTIFAVSSFAVLRWNGTARFLPLALAGALAYLIIFLMDEAYVCLENVHNGIYPKQTELMTQAITFMLMDLALLSALVWALAQTTWKFRHEILRGFGSGPTGKWPTEWPSVDVRTIQHPPGAGKLNKAMRMVRVAPARHTVVVIICWSLMIVANIVAFTLPASAKEALGPPLDTLEDMMTPPPMPPMPPRPPPRPPRPPYHIPPPAPPPSPPSPPKPPKRQHGIGRLLLDGAPVDAPAVPSPETPNGETPPADNNGEGDGGGTQWPADAVFLDCSSALQGYTTDEFGTREALGFRSALSSTLWMFSVQETDVTITAVDDDPSRRRLLSGVTVSYAVTTTSADASALSKALTNFDGAAAVSALQDAGLTGVTGVTTQPPTTSNTAPQTDLLTAGSLPSDSSSGSGGDYAGGGDYSGRGDYSGSSPSSSSSSDYGSSSTSDYGASSSSTDGGFIQSSSSSDYAVAPASPPRSRPARSPPPPKPPKPPKPPLGTKHPPHPPPKPPKPPPRPKAYKGTDYSGKIRLLHDIINALLDSLGPAACISSIILTYLYAQTYVLIWQDHVLISRRWPPGRAAEFYNAPVPSPLVGKIKGKVMACMRKCRARGKEVEEEEKAVAEQPPKDAVIVEKSVGCRFEDGTLDIVHTFQYVAAAAYPSTLFFCSILSYLLTLIIFELLIFPLFFKNTRAIILGLFGASAFFPILLSFMEKFVVSRVVSKNFIRMPRVYLYYDLALSFTVAMTAGLSAAFVRLISGLISAYLRLVTLQAPVLTGSLAASDSGLAVYGGLMKCRYMCIMEELGFISGHEVEYTVAPEALPEGHSEERVVSLPAPDDLGAKGQQEAGKLQGAEAGGLQRIPATPISPPTAAHETAAAAPRQQDKSAAPAAAKPEQSAAPAAAKSEFKTTAAPVKVVATSSAADNDPELDTPLGRLVLHAEGSSNTNNTATVNDDGDAKRLHLKATALAFLSANKCSLCGGDFLLRRRGGAPGQMLAYSVRCANRCEEARLFQ